MPRARHDPWSRYTGKSAHALGRAGFERNGESTDQDPQIHILLSLTSEALCQNHEDLQ